MSREAAAALADTDKAEVLRQFGGGPFSAFKQALAELAVDKLGRVGAEMSRLLNEPDHIDQVLKQGAERAASIAEPVLREVKTVVGFVQSRFE